MITDIIYILLAHTIADFIFQTRKMGLNKGKSIKWLTIHVSVYSLVTSVFWYLYFDWSIFYPVFALTFLTHWVTDFITSKLSGYCYLKMLENKGVNEKSEHTWQYHFWSVIGFDQLIHSITLLLTYQYIIKPI